MSRLSRNIAYNAAGQVGIAILSLLAVKCMFARLGGDAFGVISIGLVWNAVVTSALELGLSSVTVRELARTPPEARGQAVDLVRTSSTIYWALCALLAGATYVVAPAVVSAWLHVDSPNRPVAVAAVRILAISGLLGVPRTLYNAVLRGLEEMGAANIIEVAARIVQSAGILAVTLAGGGLITVCWWLAAVYAGILGAYAMVIGRRLPLLALVPGWSGAAVRANARFAGGTAVISVTAVAQIQADKVILSRAVSVAEVGFYTTAVNLVSRAQLLVLAVVEASLPSLTRALGDPPTLRARYEKLQDLVVHGTLPVFGVLLILTGPVMTYTFGPQVAAQLAVPAALLALGMFLNATMSMPYMMSIASGHAPLAARSNAISVPLVVPLVVLAAARFGLNGAALSWILFDAWGYAYLAPRIATRCLGCSPAAWFTQTSRALPGVLMYAAAWYAAAHLLDDGSWVQVSVLAVAVSAVYAVVAYNAITETTRTVLSGHAVRFAGSVRSILLPERAS